LSRLVAWTFVASTTLNVPPAAAEQLFPSIYVPLVAESSVGRVGIADVTGDGVADIVYLGTDVDRYYDSYPRIGSFLGRPNERLWTRGSVAEFDVGDAHAMAITDLDGDGRADVVVVIEPRYDPEMLWVGLGRAGGLMPATEIPLSGRPIAIAAGDLDGDGRPDVAVAREYADSVSILCGTGDGGLAPCGGIAVVSPWRIAVGDLNGDGRQDVVVVDTDGNIYSFLSNGSGGFGQHWGVHIGGLLEPIALADLNGDGVLDLLVPKGVMLGDGAGGFGLRMDHGVDGPFTVGDFNADGRPDLAVLSGAGLYVLTGRGDGTFVTAASYQVAGSDVVVGDLDRDGNLDLCVAGGTIRDLYGNGDGTFGQKILSFPVGRFPDAIATGDLNGDHRVDLVVANRLANSISILLGAGDGRFVPGPDLATGPVPYDIALADFDRDGRLDLAVAEVGSRTVSVFRGRGDGTFAPRVVMTLPTGEPNSLKTGDFDEDGFPDLAVSDGALNVWLFFGGPGGIGTGRLAQVRFVTSGQNLAVADITGDGHLDIVLQGDDMAYVPGHGDGTFGSPDWERGPQYGYFYSLATIDLCHNCTHQVLAGSYCCVLTNGGNERYLEWVFGGGCRPYGGVIGTVSGGAMTVGDLNGDGIDDLATAWTGMTVLLGNGHGWFDSRQDFGVPVGLSAIADVNGDGKQDLIVLNTARDSVVVLLNQAARPTVPRSPEHVTADAGAASIALSWNPVDHPDLTGYRICYDSRGGTTLTGSGASEGSSPIQLPASRTAVTLHCLPESTFTLRVTAVDRWGRESQCTPLVSARPGPVGGEFSFVGGSLRSGSHSPWVMGLIELDGLSAADIVPGTVTMNGVAASQFLGIADRNHDGLKELMVRFSRAAVEAAGNAAHAHVEGRVAGCRDTLRFAVDDSVRIGKPGARPQNEAPEDPTVTDQAVTTFALHPVAPSPASQGCTIGFDLPEPVTVRLRVYDLRGRLVSTVLDREMPVGAHRVQWDRQGLPDGVYFASIEAGAFKAVRRIVLIR